MGQLRGDGRKWLLRWSLCSGWQLEDERESCDEEERKSSVMREKGKSQTRELWARLLRM
ncbi:hypothetical protein WN944_008281 [Citrus x changshan-huyou]|uniref:Uncharacterized protein n=1 Tax=Citrus x changshan-huyou TaxID=2935761 RepID=A0AAP0MMM2_9ROSI